MTTATSSRVRPGSTGCFNGAGAREALDIAANGGRVLFSCNGAPATIGLDDVERIDVNALDGSDTIVVSKLSGTRAPTSWRSNLSLATFPGGGGDRQPDTRTGGPGGDVLQGGPGLLGALAHPGLVHRDETTAQDHPGVSRP